LLRQSTANEIISSKLLILQSKRLMLTTAERRLILTGHEGLRSRVEELRRQAEQAQHAYRNSVLALEEPDHPEYWLVAYSRLIEMGSALTFKLRAAVTELPPSERYQVAADVEVLEGILAGWSESMRRAMAAAVA
jgi:hypothetical protein